MSDLRARMILLWDLLSGEHTRRWCRKVANPKRIAFWLRKPGRLERIMSSMEKGIK